MFRVLKCLDWEGKHCWVPYAFKDIPYANLNDEDLQSTNSNLLTVFTILTAVGIGMVPLSPTIEIRCIVAAPLADPQQAW